MEISGPQAIFRHRIPKLITWTRTWLLLARGVVLQTVIYKGLYGIDRFFLKEIKNVMFLNKIDVPYCLVVFFVVCPRLRPFWSVFGELALFWCPTAIISLYIKLIIASTSLCSFRQSLCNLTFWLLILCYCCIRCRIIWSSLQYSVKSEDLIGK